MIYKVRGADDDQPLCRSLLNLYRDYQLERDVAPHVEDASAACHHVLVGIFQSAQVVLVGFVQQVVGCDIEFGYLPAFHEDVRASRERQQRIARCLRLRVVCAVDMRLFQIAVESSCDIEVVEQRAVGGIR